MHDRTTGTSVHEYRTTRDRAAAARAGIDSRREDFYDDDPRDLVVVPRDEVPMVLGRCPIDGTALFAGSCGGLTCEWTGHRFPWPGES